MLLPNGKGGYKLLRVATFPNGIKDVDQLLNTEGGDARYERMIAEARPGMTWMIDHLDSPELHPGRDLSTPQGAQEAVEDIVDTLARQPAIARMRYVRELAVKLGMPEAQLRQALNETVRERRARHGRKGNR